MREALRQLRIAVSTIGIAALLTVYTHSAVHSELAASAPAGFASSWVSAGLPVERGEASHYALLFSGLPTASGELYWPLRRTAAHRTLPLGSEVEVTNLANGRSTVVRINDRGPYSGGRVIDLSHAAARDLGMLQPGSAPVELRVLAPAG